MTPHGIDGKRYEALLRYGVGADALIRFMRSNRATLLRAGERVQNPPTEPMAVYRVVRAFGPKAQKLLGDWIADTNKEKGELAIGVVLQQFQDAESGGKAITDDERASYYHAGLLELLRPEPEAEWIAFLRSEIPNNGKAGSPTSPLDWLTLARCWLGQSAAPSDDQSLASAVVKLRDAVEQRDPRRLAGATALAAVSEELTELIQSASKTKRARGVIATGAIERMFDPAVDYTSYLLVATNRSVRTEEPFVATVEAFLDDSGEVFTLSAGELRRAIPEEGRIVLFGDRGFASAPPQGEAFVYRAERYPTDNRHKARGIDRYIDALFPVIHLHAHSGDAHKVRDLITSYARAGGSRSAIFVTQDNCCVKPRGTSIRDVLKPDFPWQLDQWESLEAVELANGAYVVGPLPPTEWALDCAPLSITARRLVKELATRKDAGITKAQRDKLLEIFEDDEQSISSSARERLRANIATIDSSGEDFDALLDELMEASTIKEHIEKRVLARVEAVTAERSKEQRAVNQLKSEKANLEQRIASLEDDAQKAAKAVRTAVLKSFENAAKKGEEVLGQTALLGAMLARPSGIDPRSGGIQSSARTIVLRAESPEEPLMNLADIFRMQGIKLEIAKRLEACISLSVRLGLPIVVQGAGASVVAHRVACAIAQGSYFAADVPIGVVDPMDDGLLDSGQGTRVVLLRNAALSDMGVYASRLLDKLHAGLMDLQTRPKLIVVLSVVSGPSALPLPADVTSIAILIDGATVEAQLGTPSSSQGQIASAPLWRRIDARVEDLARDDPGLEKIYLDVRSLVAR